MNRMYLSLDESSPKSHFETDSSRNLPVPITLCNRSTKNPCSLRIKGNYYQLVHNERGKCTHLEITTSYSRSSPLAITMTTPTFH